MPGVASLSLAERRFLAWYTDMLEGESGHFQLLILFDYCQCLSPQAGSSSRCYRSCCTTWTTSSGPSWQLC